MLRGTAAFYESRPIHPTHAGSAAVRPVDGGREADVLVVAPYNGQVGRLAERLATHRVPVGTVDKFQGQEAPVVIY